MENMKYTQSNSTKNYSIATFAGGCFWCMEQPFAKLNGVIEVIPGYAGGKEKDPTYDQVSSGKTGYRESVLVVYDPKKITYNELLDVFWKQIDPTDTDGQFGDRGSHYKTAIFYHDNEQLRDARQSKLDLLTSKRFSKEIMTEILPFTSFYPAELYHRKFYEKRPDHYARYKKGSGREDFIKKMWKE